MRFRGNPRWTAALAGAAVVCLLAVPLRLEPLGRWGSALGGAAHVLLWAGWAGGIGRRLSPSRRGWPLWLGLAAFAGLAEAAQACVGRTPEWTDWLGGAGGAGLVCVTWGRRAAGRWCGALALAAVPLAWELGLQGLEAREFPVLARPGSLWAARGWELNGVELVGTPDEGFRLTPLPAGQRTAYPGLFRAPARRDWRGLVRLEMTLYWPAAAPAVMAVRIDDRPGQPSYADRFQREFAVTQGWNAVAIAAADLRTSGGRPLRLETVRQWGVFLVSETPFDYFCLGPVSMALQEERP